ncbi:MAG: dihydroorotate dehydrogenase [Candidatus Nitrosocaldaceae archaeon]|nr:MAG: dihydroorotate dehydrogenase [Candidatus Nitrosocaldaceae archaeon]
MLDIDKVRVVRIEKVREESKSVKTLLFNDELSKKAKAGQFVMVWIPMIDEIPMSVMIDDEYSAISVKRVGNGSTALYNKKEGEFIGIRGPYGNSFTIRDGNLLLVGGGTGLVPLLRLCKIAKAYDTRITLVMGSRSKDEVIFESLARRLLKDADRLIITTDDGSYGIKGSAVEPINELLDREKFDMIYTCGPELMMKKVLEIAKKYNIEAEASLERIMKCGIGLCASCCLGSYILCKDGPVLKGSELLKIEEFGRYHRDKSGRLQLLNNRPEGVLMF